MNQPSISNSEWQVMQVIWESHPLTANQIVELLDDLVDWHPRTVKTLLNRLVRKGALSFKRDGKRYLYSPKVSWDRCVRAVVGS